MLGGFLKNVPAEARTPATERYVHTRICWLKALANTVATAARSEELNLRIVLRDRSRAPS